VPFELQKGKDKDGKEVVWIEGVASSATKDSDQETLIPAGFDFSPLLKTGFFNFNHKANNDPSAIIGEPTEAKIINNGKDFWVKGFIYPEGKGLETIQLAQRLEKYSPNRRLGFSIEGQAVERDPFDGRKITKARITSIAITHCPKNPNTLLQLVKGEYSEPFVEDTDEDETEKAISTESIAPAVPESVETKNNNKKSSNFDKLITKSNIYLSIAKQYPTASIAETKSIYTLIQEVNTKMFKMENNQKVYPEAIQKAFDLIANATNLIKGETTEAIVTDIVKGEEADEEEVEKALPFAEMLSKAGFDKDKACDTMCKGGISLVVAQGAWEKVISAANAAKDGDKEPEQVTAPIVKSEDIQPLVNIQDEIKKSLEPFAGTLSGIGEAIKQGFAGYTD
jgi:hypothetical protein